VAGRGVCVGVVVVVVVAAGVDGCIAAAMAVFAVGDSVLCVDADACNADPLLLL
jgi:hypothetical protein